jgi:hypothetical protein
MTLKKLVFRVITVGFLALLCHIIWEVMTYPDGIEVTIVNDSPLPIENGYFTFFDDKVSVPTIKPGQQFKAVINLSHVDGEGSIKFSYESPKGQHKEFYPCGYVERNYAGRVKVKIDGNGDVIFIENCF